MDSGIGGRSMIIPATPISALGDPIRTSSSPAIASSSPPAGRRAPRARRAARSSSATVPAAAEHATLTLADWTLPLLIGHLDPMPKGPNEGLSGVQGRLRNLGYEPGVIDGTLTDETRSAIRAFEQDNSLPVTGQISQALKDKLRARYGC